nr:MAG TPA: hypothetical protein [Caudoviricetes sp.]
MLVTIYRKVIQRSLIRPLYKIKKLNILYLWWI